MQVSIKVVVATLIAVVALCALLLAFTPLVYFAHNEAMSFVLEAAEGAADQAQYVLNSKLNALRKLGDVLHKAAQRSDLIAELQPWQLVQWAGATAVAQDWSVLLFRPDNRGFIVTAYKTVGAGGVSIPGYVYLVNLSNPGTSVLSGFFGLHAPHTPLNQTSAPWFVGATTLRYSTQPVGVILRQPNRSLSADWIGVTALRPTTASVFALLTYGGPVHAGDDPSNPQYLAVSMRSTAFSNYMKNMSVSSSGSIILFDLVTRSLVAGSISDSSAIFTNNGATPQLNLLRNLQDPKVASVLHAEYSDDQGEATGDSGLHMITTCATPCTFVFWPHSNTLRSGPFSSVFNIDVLVRSFVVVRVLQVSGSDDPDAEVSSSAPMNLRLMVTVPSDDVVGAWITATRESLLFSAAATLGFCVAFLVLSSFLLQTLSTMEAEIVSLSTVLLLPPHTEQLHEQLQQGVVRPYEHVGRTGVLCIREFQRVFSAIRHISRALIALRAFAPVLQLVVTATEEPTAAAPLSTSTIASGDAAPQNWSSSSPRSYQSAQQPQAHFHISVEQNEAPYTSAKESFGIHSSPSKVWCVPVTTMYAVVDRREATKKSRDPIDVFKTHSSILEVFQKHVALFPGAMLDNFFGDQFQFHFNAAARTPHHVLTALSVALMSSREVPPTVRFGIASSVSLCGYMGNAACKVFTVVSPVAPQAAFMSRLVGGAATVRDEYRVLLTWRAVNIAFQEQQRSHRSEKRAQSYLLLDELAQTCSFKPIVQVILPGEPHISSIAFTIEPPRE